MISLDTETTGVDLHHDARPFFVTTCDEEGNQKFWEWDVNPLTRMPEITEEDLNEIVNTLFRQDLVLQNAKFDVSALVSVRSAIEQFWPWDRTYDTLIAGHLLASNQPHDLTSMSLHYLGVNISPLEDALEQAVKECRRKVQQDQLKLRRGGKPGTVAKPTRKTSTTVPVGTYRYWLIAEEGMEGIPSAKGECWRFDYWLPRAYAKANNLPADHPYWTVLRDYANADSAATLPLWQAQRRLIQERGLEAIFRERMRLLPIAFRMEQRGITISQTRLQEQHREYTEESARLGRICTNVAADTGHKLTLPKTGNNGSLLSFVFEGLKLPIVKKTPTGAPAFDKYVLEHYLSTLPQRSKAAVFVKALSDKRKRDSAISYMEGYERFWLPLIAYLRNGESYTEEGWFVLHPSLNPTGTDTLRWSSHNPNSQNISKKEGFNIRTAFGPAPGREWWSLDAQNIELRIPAYEAGEDEMVALFERPNDPPYFGSNHLLNAHILWPELFDACKAEDGTLDGRIFKKKYASTWYQWVKNGDFAITYGAVEKSGTADRAFHTPGAQRKLQSRFRKMDALNRKCIAHAEKYGYVETLPDRSVDPKRGYPIMCTRTDWGRVLPTVPLNYHVQGTACWVAARMMVEAQKYLDKINSKSGREEYCLIMQIHDELVFDFPLVEDKGNLPIVKEMKSIMEKIGYDLVPPIPLPVGLEYHRTSWAEGESVP